MSRPLIVGYVGNFGPAHSTENEMRKAFTALGHAVLPLQENDPLTWKLLAHPPRLDMVLWTRTWHLPDMPQQAALDALNRARIPTVGFHLDRWHDLDREHQLVDEPFFRCSVVFTADGGHDRQFKTAGINHRWLPPGVSEFECTPGRLDRRYMSHIAFVGSWDRYHREWPHRQQLVAWLRRTYRGRVKFWPQSRSVSVRGDQLRNLYASAKVLIGDSCLVPTSDGPVERYWSDRIPETLGRGGFLLHPWVRGLDEHFDLSTEHGHLQTWPLNDWAELERQITWWLSHNDERRALAERGRQHVLAHHTYTHRAASIVAEVFG